jgi:hypothetical protein
MIFIRGNKLQLLHACLNETSVSVTKKQHCWKTGLFGILFFPCREMGHLHQKRDNLLKNGMSGHPEVHFKQINISFESPASGNEKALAVTVTKPKPG